MWVTVAILKIKGTVLDSREIYIMSTMRGHGADRQALTKAVGIGCSASVEALTCMTNLVTCAASTAEK